MIFSSNRKFKILLQTIKDKSRTDNNRANHQRKERNFIINRQLKSKESMMAFNGGGASDNESSGTAVMDLNESNDNVLSCAGKFQIQFKNLISYDVITALQTVNVTSQ